MYKKLKDKFGNKKGFTLVELIVVIVIILVLAAVLVPSLLKYIDSARKANCKQNAATILSQIQADYAAGQAEESFSGVSSSAIAGVTVSSAGTINESISKDNAEYSVNDKNEISAFVYNDGKHTIKWTTTGSWVFVK